MLDDGVKRDNKNPAAHRHAQQIENNPRPAWRRGKLPEREQPAYRRMKMPAGEIQIHSEHADGKCRQRHISGLNMPAQQPVAKERADADAD